MWLVDTSVWIEHFRQRTSDLTNLLLEGLVLTHPFVSGELACGNLKDRDEVLSDLNALPSVEVATDAEVLRLIEDRKLWGRGLGWVDIHLLASALLSRCRLWSADKRLQRVADELGLG
jgi:predicted nucleic acid-binding protein